jgi:hypothetical protein
MTSIAIIGAGLAGITLARALAPHARITLFEKARGLGGRMSTRRDDARQWDHGAQFFTARTPAFREWLAPFIADGTVAQWHPRITTLSPDRPPYPRPWFEPHYVAVPAMNALVKGLARGLDIRLQTRVAELERRPAGWRLRDEHGSHLGDYDWVVSAAPLPQARALLPLPDRIFDGFAMQPCYALLLAADDGSLPAWDAAVVREAPVRWIACNHRLPGRNRRAGALVVHSTPEWAAERLEDDQAEVQAQLLEVFCTLTGVAPAAITGARLHRWRYALSAEVKQPAPGFLLDPQARLAACGDWCLGGRVEAAFTSGLALAGALARRL